MNQAEIDRHSNSPTGLRERRIWLERHLLENVFPGLSSPDRQKALATALKKRVDCVTDLKRKAVDPDWTWNPGEPIPDDDHIAQAFLGRGTWRMLLPNVMCEQLYGIPLTDENVPLLDQRIGFDTALLVRASEQSGIRWWDYH